MALEGNLKDISLADMLRLLETGSKTGTLHVVHGETTGRVCFRDGEIAFASVGSDAGAMGDRLVAAGIVAEKQLRQARGLLKIQKKDIARRKLGQILVDEGYLEASVLEAFVREQASNALFDLLRMAEGDLRFEPDEDAGDADLGISVQVASVLTAADKRLQVWNRIREKIPSNDTRFVIAAGPGTQAAEIHLKPKEWMLLCHLHGGRSVDELVQLTGLNAFETAKVLYGMYANGLIEKSAQLDVPMDA